MSRTALKKTFNPEQYRGYELFCDPSYYDCWAARPIGVRVFEETAHLDTKEIALRWIDQQLDGVKPGEDPIQAS